MGAVQKPFQVSKNLKFILMSRQRFVDRRIFWRRQKFSCRLKFRWGGQTGGGTVTVSQPPKILMSTSVDTLANSLISQITTPVNVATPTPGSVSANGSSSETVTGKQNPQNSF